MYKKEGESAAPTWLLPVDIAGAKWMKLELSASTVAFISYRGRFVY